MYIPGAWTLRQLVTNPRQLFFPGPRHPDGSKVIWDEEEILRMYLDEPIDIWVNSFGGSRSNFIVDLLEQKYKVTNLAHRSKGCHYVRPLDTGVERGIFCYVEDLGVALTSQLNRNFTFNFDKLCDTKMDFSIEKWIEQISKQIRNWSSCEYFPVTMINTDKILQYSKEFRELFGIEVSGFRERKTIERHVLLKPFERQIEEVNTQIASLPDFGTFVP